MTRPRHLDATAGSRRVRGGVPSAAVFPPQPYATQARSCRMTDVVDNKAAHRFELTVDGGTAIAAYALEDDHIVFTHTEVPPALEGRGIASRLVEGALEQVRGRGLKVVPACAFVAAYIRRHPDAAELA